MRWPTIFIKCSLCRPMWPSDKHAIRRRKRLECPSCGARYDTKQMYWIGGGRCDHYGTGLALPETG